MTFWAAADRGSGGDSRRGRAEKVDDVLRIATKFGDGRQAGASLLGTNEKTDRGRAGGGARERHLGLAIVAEALARLAPMA